MKRVKSALQEDEAWTIFNKRETRRIIPMVEHNDEVCLAIMKDVVWVTLVVVTFYTFKIALFPFLDPI